MNTAPNIDDLDHDAWIQLILADVHDRAPEVAAAHLRAGDVESLTEWRDALVALIQENAAKLTRIRAEVEEKHVECGKRWDARSNEYFAFKVEKDAERRKAVRFNVKLVERLKEVKALLHEAAQDGQAQDRAWRDDVAASLARIESVLDAIAAKLGVTAR